jgi:hypothetical protein
VLGPRIEKSIAYRWQTIASASAVVSDWVLLTETLSGALRIILIPRLLPMTASLLQVVALAAQITLLFRGSTASLQLVIDHPVDRCFTTRERSLGTY